jgi:hypothetical protein
MNVSFDFDGCLRDNNYVLMICKMFLSCGHNVFILTQRDSSLLNKDVFQLAEKIGLKNENIIMTNGDPKLNSFLKYNIDLHFDDSADEVLEINNYFKKSDNPFIKNESQPAILVNFDSEEFSFLVNFN